MCYIPPDIHTQYFNLPSKMCIVSNFKHIKTLQEIKTNQHHQQINQKLFPCGRWQKTHLAHSTVGLGLCTRNNVWQTCRLMCFCFSLQVYQTMKLLKATFSGRCKTFLNFSQ